MRLLQMNPFGRKITTEILVVALILVIGGLLVSLPVSNTNYEHIEKELQEREHEESPADRQKYRAERYEYIFKMLRDPKTGKIPDNVRARELAYAKYIDQQDSHIGLSRSTAAASGFSYSVAGPYDVGGRTRALGITLGSNNLPNTYIAGGVSGGVWKSTNFGTTWTLTTSPDQSMSVTSLAQDPVNKNVWYYCGGEFVGNSATTDGAPYRGGGVYKSTDNGDSWNVLASTAVSDQISYHSIYQYCSNVIVSPTTEAIFVCSNAGVIMRSTDGGATFQQVLGGINEHYFTNIAVASNGTLIAALSEYHPSSQTVTNQAPGIYLSTDDGDTWHDITPKTSPNTFPSSFQRTVLTFAPSDPTVAYSFTYTGSKVNGHDDMRFFKYTISGTSATAVDRSANLPEFGGNVGDFAQGDYNMLVAVKPDNPDFVLIGSTNLYRSFDGFASAATDKSLNWIGGYSNQNDISSYPGNHPDQHVIAFSPGYPNRVVNGHDGGLSLTTDITQQQQAGNAVKWSSLNNGYYTTQFYALTMRNTKSDTRMLGGAQDNGSPFFRASSTTTAVSSDVSTGDGGYTYMGTNYAYASTQNGSIVRYAYSPSGDISQSGRIDVDPVSAKNQLFITPYTVDPNSEGYMYYTAGNSLWRNTDLESSAPRNNWGSGPVFSIPDTTLNITAVTASFKPSHVLYMGASGGNQDTARVYRMDNSTTATTATDVSSRAFPVGGYISDIAVNPKNANEFIVVFSNYNVSSLYYTNNGGQSYSQIQGNLQGALNGSQQYIGPSIRSAAIVNTGDGKYFLAGTSVGLYVATTLSGSTTQWTKQASGMIGDAIVSAMYARPADGWVAIGTHGRGAFLGKPNSPLPVESSPVADVPTQFSLNQNYPNPFNPSTNIPFKLDHAARVTLRVYDLTGRLVATLMDNAYHNAGQYDVRFRANQLASGTYFYRLTAITKANQLTQTRKMTLIR